jgi:hypothetical protein
MARKTPSRLQMRREVEAADEKKKTAKKTKVKTKAKTKAKTPKKKAVRKKAKDKTPARKRLIWGVFSGNLKEQARFPYDQRAAAEEKIKQLKTRSAKKMFFIQPIKEPITDIPDDDTDIPDDDEE